MDPENRKYFHPELQAELELGVEQSDVEDSDELLENISIFIEQGDEWKKANELILARRSKVKKEVLQEWDQLKAVVSKEVEFSKLMWKSKFEKAHEVAVNVVTQLSQEPKLIGYLDWWNYLAASASFRYGNRAKAIVHLEAATRNSDNFMFVHFLDDLKQPATIDSYPALDSQVENLQDFLRDMGVENSQKLDNFISDTRKGFETGDAKVFEHSLVNMGRMLGFNSENSKSSGAPDPWMFIGNEGLVFECYSEAKPEGNIGKNKVLEAKGHLDWLKVEHPTVNFQVVICSPRKKLEKPTERFSEGVYYISTEKLLEKFESTVAPLKKIWQYFSNNDDAWKQYAVRELLSSELDQKGVFECFTSTLLKDLLVDVPRSS